MSGEGMVVWIFALIVVLCVMFGGEPDIVDSIVTWLSSDCG